METGDLPGALQTLDRIIKKNPKLTEAYHKRAQVRQKLQDFEEAIAPRSTEGLLGQDFLAHYNVRILENEVELHR
ncbi:MAG: hypothetical protein EAZ09_24735 [Oscillatoriales cyanobacterium]|nr:MAG: hypothetical protein EAZ18_16150 [Oscillatoriales cyanobacterium]TAH15276.1 MAG: hypothetical protein EAZ09_24735 [Oscillatoriales cyanobacterium]